MTASEASDLWIETSRLSNRERSRIHEDRAKIVLADAWSRSLLPVVNGKVCRRWLIARIGCGSSAPSQNHRLKRVLSYWDDQIAVDSGRCIRAVGTAIDEKRLQVHGSAEPVGNDSSTAANVVPFRLDKGKIEIVRCDITSGR